MTTPSPKRKVFKHDSKIEEKMLSDGPFEDKKFKDDDKIEFKKLKDAPIEYKKFTDAKD